MVIISALNSLAWFARRSAAWFVLGNRQLLCGIAASDIKQLVRYCVRMSARDQKKKSPKSSATASAMAAVRMVPIRSDGLDER